MSYKIKWDERAYKELKKVENKNAVHILNTISKLFDNPSKAGEPLEGNFKGKFRLRVGDYRIVYWVNDDEKSVYIIAVGHRKEVYR